MAATDVETAMPSALPRIILILSGKRKAGKDYVADHIVNRFGKHKAVILRLSGPLKHQYAKERGLDFERLLDSSSYKEIYREDMIVWGEDKRNHDPGFFCRYAIEQMTTAWRATVVSSPSNLPLWPLVWIVSDARRPTDIVFFNEKYGRDRVRTVRIFTNEQVRKDRGWIFTPGVDDVESECALDEHDDWDFCLENEGNLGEHLQAFLGQIAQLIEK